jgi:filamentous hemagglutinin
MRGSTHPTARIDAPAEALVGGTAEEIAVAGLENAGWGTLFGGSLGLASKFNVYLTGPNAGQLVYGGSSATMVAENTALRARVLRNIAEIRAGNVASNFEVHAAREALVRGIAATGRSAVPVRGVTSPSAYSTAFEMRLDASVLGKSRAVDFNRANAALDRALLADPQFASIMEELIPGVRQSVSSVGGRQTPVGWTWEHVPSNVADAEIGVMRLVPTYQHTPGSAWWRVIHPNPGAAGGYREWAIPVGAPRN